MLTRRQVLMSAAAVAGTPVTTALAAATTGCAGSAGRPATGGPDEVTIVTGFGILGREGAPYVAAAKGFFAARNLKVTVQPGQAGDFNLNALDAGRAQFVVLDFAKALSLLAGLPGGSAGPAVPPRDTFRLVAATHQQTIVALMSLPGHHIAEPRDLVGKRLQQAPNTIVKILFPAYAKLAGFDPGAVTWLPDVPPSALPADLVADKVDAIGQFVPGAPSIKAAARGVDPVVLPYSRFVRDLYGNVVVASTRLVTQQPDLVSRFVAGYLQGLAYAVDNPEEAGAIVHQAAPATVDAAVAAAELVAMRPYTQAGSPQFGKFDVARVMRGIALLEAEKIIPVGLLVPGRVLAATAVAG